MTFSGLALSNLTGCSSRLFSGSDPSSTELPVYRPVHPACSGLTLSKSTLDVPTFKSLVKCFDANGAIEPIAKLVARMSDEEIGVVTDTLNRHLLQDNTTLFQLEKSFETLQEEGELDHAFASVGSLLENDDFVVASLGLLKDAWVPGSHVLEALEYLGEEATYDRFATTLNFAQNAVGSPAVGLAPAQALASLQDRLLGDMPEGLTYVPGAGCAAGQGLQTLTDCLSSFIRDGQDPAHLALGRELVNHAMSGDLFPAIDRWVGGTPDELATGVPAAAALIDYVSVNHVELPEGPVTLLDGLTSLFHYLNAPIVILDGAGVTPNADVYVFEQMVEHSEADAGEFVRRTNKLTLSAFAPFSHDPPALGKYYPALSALGATDAIVNTSHLFKALYDHALPEGGPLVRLFIDMVGDTGGSPAVDPLSGGPENTVGVKFLVPFVAELSNRQAWGDLFLTQALIRPEDRGTLSDFLRWLTAPVPKLSTPGHDRGMYDVLAEAATSARPTTLFQLAYSLRHFFGAHSPVVAPALDDLRAAFYVNSVHPGYDTLRSILRESSTNAGMFKLLIRLGDLPEFRDAVRFTSQIAKNGDLKDITFTTVSLFHRFAEQGSVAISRATPPVLKDSRRHNYSFGMLKPHLTTISPDQGAGYPDCAALDTRINILDHGGPDFASQLGAWEGCLNFDGRYTDIVSSLQFLQQTDVSGQAESYFDLLDDDLQGLKAAFTQAEFHEAISGYLKSFASGGLSRGARALPLFITQPIAVSGQPSGPVLRPAYDAAIGAYHLAGAELDRLWQFGKVIANRNDLSDATRFLNAIWEKASSPAPGPSPVAGGDPVSVPDLGPVPRWIENRECENDPEISTIADPGLRKEKEIACLVGRVERMLGNHECEKTPTSESKLAERQRVFSDYFNEITSWDLVNGGVRTSWNFGEFKSLLDPLLNRMADLGQSEAGRALVDAPFQFLHYFTLAPGESPSAYAHYTPLQFLHWLRDKASDAKVISYYYPSFGSACSAVDPGPAGNDEDPRCAFEATPRVRMVSTLDRLELVLVNADFMAPIGFKPGEPLAKIFPDVAKQNNAYFFLELLGNAWGDEPESLWPAEIHALAATMRKANPHWQPDTLADVAKRMDKTLDELGNLVGTDTPPKCAQAVDPSDPEAVQKFETAEATGPGIIGWLPIPQRAQMRARLYNMHQVVDVLNDILAEKGDPGARVLRDLFFELYYSTPEAFRNPNEDCDRMESAHFAGNICRNNLWATMRLARLGILHQAGRLLRSIPADDRSLQDFFDTMLGAVRGDAPISSAANPSLTQAVHAVIVDDRSHGLFWGIEQRLFGIIDAASGVPTAELDQEHQAELTGLDPAAQASVREGWTAELPRLKQLVYYFMASLEPNQLTQDAVATAAPVLAVDVPYLTGKTGLLRSALRSAFPATAIRAFYDADDASGRAAVDQMLQLFLVTRASDGESMGSDAAKAWVRVSTDASTSALMSLAASRLQAARALPEYQTIGFPPGGTVAQSLLDFLQSTDGTEATIRRFAGQRFEAGDVDALLRLAYTRPDETYGFLAALANHVASGDMDTAFAIIDRALVSAEPG